MISQNLKFKVQNSFSGFTLIELLAVMGVLIAIGTVMGGILFSALRGSTKTNTIVRVKQNGGYALNQMAKMIRDARRLDAEQSCIAISPTPIATSSSLTIVNFDGGQTTFICNDMTNGVSTIASQSGSDTPVSLLDTTAVGLSACYFTCIQETAASFPVVSIFFSLTSGTANPSFTERLASSSAIPFQTSVILRNLR